MFIPDPDLDFLPIPDPWVKKAPDPGYGSATLVLGPLSWQVGGRHKSRVIRNTM
jgi:hypothetical protein